MFVVDVLGGSVAFFFLPETEFHSNDGQFSDVPCLPTDFDYPFPHSVAVTTNVSSKQEGCGFSCDPGLSVWSLHSFSLSLHGFSPDTPTSFLTPKTLMLGWLT